MASQTENKYLADFDNLHVIGTELYSRYTNGELSKEEVLEQIQDWIIAGFSIGTQLGLEDLDSDEVGYLFFKNMASSGAFLPIVQEVTNRKIDDQTTEERVYQHLENKDGASSIEKVMETEYHHAANKGIQTVGDTFSSSAQEIEKTWKTMLDEKVRDTHAYLEGITIPLGYEFYTYNGDHAMFPGEFDVAEEDCNCRCRIKLSIKKAQTVTGK